MNRYDSEEKKSEIRLFEDAEIFFPFVEFNEDEIVLTDADFNIKYINVSFSERFLSDKKNSAETKNLKEIFGDDVIEKIAFAVATMRKGDIGIYKFGFLFEDANKETLSYCVKVFKTNNAEGETLYILAFHNKTQEKKLIEKYLYAKEEAESSQKAKDIFLSQISHEIRTPLNKILSYTNLLKAELENSLSDEMKNAFKIVEKASMRLVRTFDLLINLSEIQANAYKCEFSEIDLVENIINPVVEEYKKAAEEKGLAIEKDFPTEKITVTGDLYSVHEIFSQILDNAVKYTYEGSVKISLRKNADGNVTLQVTDSGIGISEEYLPRIFDTFSQEEVGYSRTYEGNGIGLTIVRKFCELNNIGINVTSKKGTGTTVTLTFKTKRKFSFFTNN